MHGPTASAEGVLPVVDWDLLTHGRRTDFITQLRAALSDVGFLVSASIE
jgi:hypothetical protein